ncbi:MAG: hypothetical protein ACR2P0_05540, partial [Acidimicrobiales bacterium]
MTTAGENDPTEHIRNRRLTTGVVTECSEIMSDSGFRELVDRAPATREFVVQGLDLVDRTQEILGRPWYDTTFLGCRMDADADDHIRTTGGVTFPAFDRLPYNPYRGTMYSPSELRHGELDRSIYEHQQRFREAGSVPILEALAQRIHDHAIDDALHEFLFEHDRVVAIMGGHSLHRDEPTFRTVVTLARELARQGFL